MNMFLASIKTGLGWLDTLIAAIMNIINPILILVAVAGIVYSIVVGVKFVKADSKDQREEAKQKLISVIIGIIVTIVLIALFYFLAFNIGPGEMIDPTNSGLI